MSGIERITENSPAHYPMKPHETVFRPGDPIVYRKDKVGPHPGPRAIHVHPAPRGELYHYQVDKLWVVAGPPDEEGLPVRTRRGKVLRIDPASDRVRRASWLDRLRYRGRFPRLSG